MTRLPTLWRLAAVIAVFGAAEVFGSTIANAYVLHLLVLTCIFSVLVMSHNLVTGYVGLFHLCHAAFFGIGAYISALLAIHLNLPVPLTFVLGAIGAAISGLAVGLLSVRLGGHYFAIVSLGLGVIVYQILNNWVDLTAGPIGLSGIPLPPEIPWFGGSIAWTPHVFLAVGMVFVLLTYVICTRIQDSKVGLIMKAIRENELAAACVGIRTERVKVVAFTIAAFLAGAAGGMYAHYTRMLVPEQFSFIASAELVAMTVLGGLGSFGGSIASAAFFTIAPEMLRVAGQWRLEVFGALLVIVVLFFPRGMAGLGALIWAGIVRLIGRFWAGNVAKLGAGRGAATSQ
jgi:branched-chain amino acid transport system permease protein